MVYCFGELGEFPESEFVHTIDGKIFQPPIHHVQPEHWATTGLFVDPETFPNVNKYDRAKGIIEIKLAPKHGNNLTELPEVVDVPESDGEA